MKAIIWHYRFADMKKSWAAQMGWLVKALQNNGVEVKKHKEFICTDLDIPIYDHKKDHDADICIYNHTDASFIIGNVLKVKQNWFFKPTVPDQVHTTLDTLGYGPYSSITYEKPPFEEVTEAQVKEFFDNRVSIWKKHKLNKWGTQTTDVEIPHEDYYLVLGQCGGDSVVTHFDFGNYFTKLEQMVRELVRVDTRPVIVKLHPFTDGEEGTKGAYKNNEFSESLKKRLEEIPNVKCYIGKSNIHRFIEKARCVLLANSGAGFEVMMHHKPIISWGFPEYHWVTYDLRHLAELHRAIKLDWFDRDKQDKFLYWYMERYCYFDQLTADKRVKQLLNEIQEDTFDDLWRKFEPSQNKEEFRMFLDLVKKSRNGHNPVVVEIGVRRGHQRYFYKNLLNAEYKGIDVFRTTDPDFIQGDSSKPETVNRLKEWLNGRKIDVLFIDGNHKYDGVKADWENYGGLADMVAFHDIVTPNKLNQDVCRFWEEVSKNKRVFEIKAKGDGIGIIMQEDK
jgi:hypothetical protein